MNKPDKLIAVALFSEFTKFEYSYSMEVSKFDEEFREEIREKIRHFYEMNEFGKGSDCRVSFNDDIEEGHESKNRRRQIHKLVVQKGRLESMIPDFSQREPRTFVGTYLEHREWEKKVGRLEREIQKLRDENTWWQLKRRFFPIGSFDDHDSCHLLYLSLHINGYTITEQGRVDTPREFKAEFKRLKKIIEKR